MAIQIITHRGLEPSRQNFYSESTMEAFANHLQRGFSIEFDVRFLRDGNIVIVHDATLARITKGQDTRKFEELTLEDVRKVQLSRGRIGTFDELMNLIRKSSSAMNSLHFKGILQTSENISKLLEYLKKHEDLLGRILIFDITEDTARKMLDTIPSLSLYPSVSHAYDIERYNSVVAGTLMTIEDAVKGAKECLYRGVWLDEWDLTGPEGTTKTLNNMETFTALREAGLKIALVTPELHTTSPGLLGGEVHQDAVNKKRLFERIVEIIALKPDAICTDYPEEVLQL